MILQFSLLHAKSLRLGLIASWAIDNQRSWNVTGKEDFFSITWNYTNAEEKALLFCWKLIKLSLWTIFSLVTRPRRGTLVNLGTFRNGWVHLAKHHHKWKSQMLPFCSEYFQAKTPKVSLNSFQQYWWPENLAIWLDQGILAYS